MVKKNQYSKYNLIQFTLISFIIASSFQICNSQNCFFAKKIGNSNDQSVFETVKTIVSDSQENIYALGTYSNSADLDPGPATFSVSGGFQNSYIIKLDVNGNFIWGLNFPDISFVGDIAIDGNSDLIVAGSANQATDLNPGAGTYTTSGSCSFILKLNSSGNFLWAKPYYYNGANYISFTDITADVSNNIILTGRLSGASYDMDPGSGTTTINGTQMSSGTYRMDFLTKISGAGNFTWVKTFEGSPTAFTGYKKLVKTDGLGNIIVCGDFSESIDLDPSPTSQYILNAPSTGSFIGPAVFTCKLNSNGNFVWAQSVEVNSASGFLSIDVDGLNNIYLSTGLNQNSDLDGGTGICILPFTNGGYNYFISKINSNGVFQWAKYFGGLFEAGISALAHDSNNNIYASLFYNFANSASPTTGPDFDPGPGIMYANNPRFGLGIVKLNSIGNFISRKTFSEGSNSNITAAARIESFYIKNGSIFCAGAFPLFTNDFDPNPITTTMLGASGHRDGFICKFPLLSPIVQSSVNPSCANVNDGSITINVLDGQPTYTYSWSGFPANNSTSLNNIPAGTYTAIITDVSGCSQAAPPITLSSPQPISINFSTSDESCVNNGNNGSAFSSVTGGVSPYQYNWSLASQLNGPDIQNVSAGTYSLVVTDANGCKDSAVAVINYEYNPSSFTYTTNGMVVQFSKNGTGCNNFVWDFGNGNTSTINPNPVVTYATAGTYGVCLECNGQPAECVKCVNISLPSNSTGGVGIEELSNSKYIRIFPNPNNGIFIIDINENTNETDIDIFNTTGQKVYTNKIIEPQLYLTELPSGVYDLQLKNKNGDVRHGKINIIKQ